jgi:hypothetical protein
MTSITVLDHAGAQMCTVSADVAHKMEARFEIGRIDEGTARMLTADEARKARRAAVRKVTGLAHPHDHASDSDFVPGGEFDEFVAAGGPDLFV